MSYNKLVLALSIMFSLVIASNAQTHAHEHNHGQHDHHHEHPANEIGIGNFVSYLTGEQELAYGIHLHYLRAIKGSRFGYGIGYEQIFDEHIHRVAGIIGSYRLTPNIIITLSPGILFPNQENPKSSFVVHSELVYEFEIGPFHLGPTIELATTFEELHLGAGFHVGLAF